MGSDAHVIVVGGSARLIDEAVARVGELEQRWSRFLPDSEISQLNRWAGIPVAVSPDTVTLVDHAIVAWRLSGGAFDPTVLGDVIRAGYDRSFERLSTVRGDTWRPKAGYSALGQGADAIVVNGETVMLPAGTGFDPGGIGKGLAADLICAEMLAGGAAGVCINLGGDLRVAGAGPDGGCWTVAVEHPEAAHPVVLLGLTGGAVATSTTRRRHWLIGDEDRHHLIDPQTGRPSDTDLTMATVVAGQAWIAEVLAKAVILAGSAHAFDIVGGTAAQALAVDRHGVVQATPGMSGFLGDVAVPAICGHMS